jgi:hypothetical protein
MVNDAIASGGSMALGRKGALRPEAECRPIRLISKTAKAGIFPAFVY